MEALVKHLDFRLTNSDVWLSLAFQYLTEKYCNNHADELVETQPFRYYLTTKGPRRHVSNRSKHERIPSEKLTEFSVVDWLFEFVSVEFDGIVRFVPRTKSKPMRNSRRRLLSNGAYGLSIFKANSGTTTTNEIGKFGQRVQSTYKINPVS